MAEGRWNTGIAHQLNLSPKNVEANVAAIFSKLSMPPGVRNLLEVPCSHDGPTSLPNLAEPPDRPDRCRGAVRRDDLDCC